MLLEQLWTILITSYHRVYSWFIYDLANVSCSIRAADSSAPRLHLQEMVSLFECAEQICALRSLADIHHDYSALCPTAQISEPNPIPRSPRSVYAITSSVLYQSCSICWNIYPEAVLSTRNLFGKKKRAEQNDHFMFSPEHIQISPVSLCLKHGTLVCNSVWIRQK